MSMKKNLKYLLLLSLLSFMACNGDEKIDLGMVQQDGEVLQLNVRVGDFAINDVSSIRATDSGSTGTFENGDRIGIIVLDADNNVLSDNIPYRYDGNIWSFDSNNDEGKTTIYYDNKATVYLAYFPMQHIRPVDYQCFINKMVEKSVLHFFFFAERVQN